MEYNKYSYITTKTKHSKYLFVEIVKPQMDKDQDIRLSGYGSCVGKSSMEVTLNVDQVNYSITQLNEHIHFHSI